MRKTRKTASSYNFANVTYPFSISESFFHKDRFGEIQLRRVNKNNAVYPLKSSLKFKAASILPVLLIFSDDLRE